MADLRTRVGSVELATPVIAAAGTYGYGIEYDGLVDWSLVGGVSVKGISLKPWKGHPAPRMVETPSGMLNAIGLQNVGLEVFLRDKLPYLRDAGVPVIANCWGDDDDGFAEVAAELSAADGVAAVEINLSCPHKNEWGGLPAADPVATERIVAAVRARCPGPLWVKLSPNVSDITEIARAAEAGGADALTLINTLRGLVIDIEARKPALANGQGGLSGPAIRPVAVFQVHEAAGAVKIPVVGVGGIVEGRDVVEMIMAGAAAVQVGTANLFDPSAPAKIASETSIALDRIGAVGIEEIRGCV